MGERETDTETERERQRETETGETKEQACRAGCPWTRSNSVDTA